MSQEVVPYDELKQEIAVELKKREWGHVATSQNDYVRVGYMRIVSKGLTLWVYTDHRSRKFKQLLANPRIAVGDRDLQIEGLAKLKGHPLDEENKEYIDAYRENQPENYMRTSKRQFLPSRPEWRVIEIIPSRITWYKVGATPEENVFLILDTVNQKAYRLSGKEVFETDAYKSGLK